MTKEELEKLIEIAKTTGKITNCLGVYKRKDNSCYSKPEEIHTMLKQLFAALDFHHKK